MKKNQLKSYMVYMENEHTQPQKLCDVMSYSIFEATKFAMGNFKSLHHFGIVSVVPSNLNINDLTKNLEEKIKMPKINLREIEDFEELDEQEENFEKFSEIKKTKMKNEENKYKNRKENKGRLKNNKK